MPWVADLMAKGHDLPDGRADVFKARESFEKPADRGYRYIPTRYSAEDSDTAFLADEFLKWVAVRNGRPWFAHVVFMRPHPPLVAPEPYNAMHDPASVPFPERAATPEAEGQQHPFLEFAMSKLRRPGAYDEHSPLDLLAASDLEIRQMRAAYYGLIAEVDAHVGRIVEYLKATGQYDQTLIVFTSDHAEMLGRALSVGQGVLLRPVVPSALDHPRSACRGQQHTRFNRRGFHRGYRRHADTCRLDGSGGAARHATATLSCRSYAARNRPTGGRRSSGSTISAMSSHSGLKLRLASSLTIAATQ